MRRNGTTSRPTSDEVGQENIIDAARRFVDAEAALADARGAVCCGAIAGAFFRAEQARRTLAVMVRAYDQAVSA